jgi:hypothetical protein
MTKKCHLKAELWRIFQKYEIAQISTTEMLFWSLCICAEEINEKLFSSTQNCSFQEYFVSL